MIDDEKKMIDRYNGYVGKQAVERQLGDKWLYR